MLLIQLRPELLVDFDLLVLVGEIQIVELQTFLYRIGDRVLLSDLIRREKGACQLGEQLQRELLRVEIEVATLEIVVVVHFRVRVRQQPVDQRRGRGDGRVHLPEFDSSGVNRADLAETIDGDEPDVLIRIVRSFEKGENQTRDDRRDRVARQTHLQKCLTVGLQQLMQTVQRVQPNVDHVEVEQADETLEFVLQDGSFVGLELRWIGFEFAVLFLALVQFRLDLVHLIELGNEQEVVGDDRYLIGGNVIEHREDELLEILWVDLMEGEERGDQLQNHRRENIDVRAEMANEFLPEVEHDGTQLGRALKSQTKRAEKFHAAGNDLSRFHDFQHFG